MVSRSPAGLGVSDRARVTLGRGNSGNGTGPARECQTGSLTAGTWPQPSDRAGLHEEDECGAREPGEQRQLGRSRCAQGPRGDQVDDDPDSERGSRLGKPEEDLEDEVAHESDRPTALERPDQRDLIRVFEVPADWQAPREPGDDSDPSLEPLRDVGRGDVSLQRRVGCEGDLLEGLAIQLGGHGPLEELGDPQSLWADPIHRADGPIEHVVPTAPLARALDGEDVERFLDDAEAAAIARSVSTDRARGRVADVEADGAEDDLIANGHECRRERARLRVRRPEQVVGEALGRLRVDLDAHEVLLASHDGADYAAAGRSLQDGRCQLLLDALHVLLHLQGHLLEIAEAHPNPILRRPPHGAPLVARVCDIAPRRAGPARDQARQSTSRTPTSSSPHTARAAAITAVPSESAGGVTSISTLVATHRTATGRPRTRESPSSRVGRRRSATSRRKSWHSGNPSVTTAPSTASGRHASMRGFVGGWRLISATTSGHRRRSSTRGSSAAGVVDAGSFEPGMSAAGTASG